MHSMQIFENACSNQSTKGIGERAAGIEPGNSMAQLSRVNSVQDCIACGQTSCRVYQLDLFSQSLSQDTLATTYINITAPGKNGASTNPRKNRATTSPVNEVDAA